MSNSVTWNDPDTQQGVTGSTNTAVSPVYLIDPITKKAISPNITEVIRNGQGYQASTGKLASATNANVVMGMGIFNNSTAKNIFIYSLRFGLSAASGLNQLNLTTADPAMGTALTIVNLKAGGAASVATVSAPANNLASSVSVIGTQFDTITENASVVFEVFSNGSGVLLPAGAANGLAFYTTMGTAANNYSSTMKWIEY